MFATLRQKKMVWAEFEERYESDSMRQGLSDFRFLSHLSLFILFSPFSLAVMGIQFLFCKTRKMNKRNWLW